MNGKRGVALGATLAALTGVAVATLDPVVTGLAVNVPLLTGTAGSFTLPLAVIGVIKLAAAASISGVDVFGPIFQLAGLGKGLLPALPEVPSPLGYNKRQGYQQRQRRSAANEIDGEAVFGLVSSLDMYSCGKALVCSLRAKDQAQLADDEALIMSLFAVKPASRYSLGGPKAEYNLAAEYGALAKDEVACQIRYQECPYTADQMMATLRSSNL
jgi:hypothetical protein